MFDPQIDSPCKGWMYCGERNPFFLTAGYNADFYFRMPQE
jgi:hypothetical protein